MRSILGSQQTIWETLAWGSQYLKAHDNKYSVLEAELILSCLLGCERLELYLKRDNTIEEDIIVNFKDLMEKRSSGMPLQYLTKRCFFYGLQFYIEEGVFIPRPETEVLVEEIINLVKNNFKSKAKILEFCTGSGNIAVTLTKYIADCRIVAVDVNAKALRIAKENARFHGVDKNIDFLEGDLFSVLENKEASDKTFDIIVANPPYIPRRDFSRLPQDVRCEPRNALDGGNDGLDFYVRILREAVLYLKEGGFIAFEFGDGQDKKIFEFIDRCLFLEKPVFFEDLNKIKRCVIARRKNG